MGGGASLIAVGEARRRHGTGVGRYRPSRLEPEGVTKIAAFMGENPDGFESLEEVGQAIASYQPHRQRSRNPTGFAKNVRRAGTIVAA